MATKKPSRKASVSHRRPQVSPERKAWEALWKAYVTAIKAKKIDVAERLKKQIDGFDQKHFGKKV